MQMTFFIQTDMASGCMVNASTIQITHGTGCTLSSAIASNLARGFSLEDSVRRSKQYLTDALKAQLDLGHGSGPLDHTLGKTQ